MGKNGKKSQQGKFSDHIIIGTVLVVTSLVYIGFALTSKEDSSTHNHSHPETETPTEMAAFLENLPSDFEALVSMGNALMDKGEYSLALECYSRALEQNPDDTDVRTDLGTCRHALGDNKAAIADFMKVLEINPAHEIAKFNLGIVYLSLEDSARAFDWWQKLLNENPSEELKLRLESIMNEVRQGS